MALPGNITLITLTGQYLDFQGVPILGQVKIYPSQVLIDSAADRIIIPSVITQDLSDGEFSLEVPVTNDPDVTPLNYTYLFEESFEGGSTYRISLPSSLGATVDITDIRLDATVVDYIQPIAYQLWPPLKTRTETQEAYYSGASIPTTSLPIPSTYQWLYLYYDTYASMASAWGTYASAVNPLLTLTNARIQQIYDRMTRLDNFTATSTDLRETTNLGVVTRSTYGSLMAKYGVYSGVPTPYPLYSNLTSASISWTYAQIGALRSQMGNALTTTDMREVASLTDPLLEVTKTIQGNDYGALTFQSTYLTYGALVAPFSDYGTLGLSTFSVIVRDWADRLRTAANHPHPLLMKEYQYGISV